MSLSPDQQKEYQKLQQMSQQLNQLYEQYRQMQARQNELNRTLDALKEVDDDEEVYKNVGQIMFKADAGEVRSDLEEELELLEVRVKKSKKQVEDFEAKVKQAQQKLQQSIQ